MKTLGTNLQIILFVSEFGLAFRTNYGIAHRFIFLKHKSTDFLRSLKIPDSLQPAAPRPEWSSFLWNAVEEKKRERRAEIGAQINGIIIQLKTVFLQKFCPGNPSETKHLTIHTWN